MSQIHGDPQAIQQFALQLSTFAQTSREHVMKLRGHLDQLGSTTWTDHNHNAYKEEFTQIITQLNTLLLVLQEEQPAKLQHLAKLYMQVRV